MITRLYTGDDGQSHFEELDMDVGPYPWRELRTATGIMFRTTNPARSSTGIRRQDASSSSRFPGKSRSVLTTARSDYFGPGDVMLAEDTTGRGHTTRAVGDVPRVSVAIPVD